MRPSLRHSTHASRVGGGRKKWNGKSDRRDQRHVTSNDFDFSIPRVAEIKKSALGVLNSNLSGKNFELIGFVVMMDGEPVGGHMVLSLGRDESTGKLLIFDPELGKSALFSLQDTTDFEKQTLHIKFESSEDNDPFWGRYRKYKVVVTGLISVKIEK